MEESQVQWMGKDSFQVYRVKKALTLAEKVDVIRMSEKISNTRQLARIFGCGRTQIQNVLRHRQEYFEEWCNNGNPYRVRRKRCVALIALGAVVYEWVQRCRSLGIAITDGDIRQTGRHVADILQMPEFRPHNRWLQRFKNKYKLFNLDLLGLDPTVNGTDITKKSIKLEDIIADLQDPRLEEHAKNVGVYLYLSEKLAPSVNQSNESDDNIPLVLTSESSDSSLVYEKTSDKTITSYKDALNYLGPLEHFALMEEDIRAVGLINQLENLFRENMQLQEN